MPAGRVVNRHWKSSPGRNVDTASEEITLGVEGGVDESVTGSPNATVACALDGAVGTVAHVWRALLSLISLLPLSLPCFSLTCRGRRATLPLPNSSLNEFGSRPVCPGESADLTGSNLKRNAERRARRRSRSNPGASDDDLPK